MPHPRRFAPTGVQFDRKTHIVVASLPSKEASEEVAPGADGSSGEILSKVEALPARGGSRRRAASVKAWMVAETFEERAVPSIVNACSLIEGCDVGRLTHLK